MLHTRKSIIASHIRFPMLVPKTCLFSIQTGSHITCTMLSLKLVKWKLTYSTDGSLGDEGACCGTSVGSKQPRMCSGLGRCGSEAELLKCVPWPPSF